MEGAALDEGLLHRVEFAGRGQMLDRDHLAAVEKDREREAARNRLAVDQHGAAAAQALPAALARAGERELRLQHFDDVVVRLHVGGDRPAVEGELNRAGAPACQSSPSGLPALARNARSTDSAVSGNSVSRTPTASSMALAIAGETPKVASSPTPLAPNGPLLW